MQRLLQMRYFAVFLALALGGTFLLFVWPTRYRYDRLENVPVRIDRLTGRPEMLTGGGWRPMGHSEPTAQDEGLPPPELARLTGRCHITGWDSSDLSCDIYNNSTWKLSQIIVAITVEGTDVRDRQFRVVIPGYGGKPLESTLVDTRLGFSVGDSQHWHWNIVSARGVRAQ